MDLANFTDVLGDADEIGNSQPLSLSLSPAPANRTRTINTPFQRSIDICSRKKRPPRRTGQQGDFRSVEEIDEKYRDVFIYPYFNLVQSSVIDDALYTDKSMVVCAPTGSGKTVIFEMAIVQLLMDLDDKNYTGDFKIIYMAPVKALCTERLSEWYPKFTKLGLMCIEVTGDTTVDFSQLKPYRIIITTPEKWDILTRRWRDHKSLVEVIKLFLIDEVHILNDNTRGPVLEAVVSRMKTIESSSQSAYRIEQLQKQYQSNQDSQRMANKSSLPVRIRFVAVSATISNPEDVAAWLGASDKPAVFYKFGDECRPVKLKRVVEGYPCSEGTSIFKFDIILNYKLWPVIQKYHDGKPTLIFCNTRKSVTMTAETLSRELTVGFTPEQQARLTSLASTIKNKKLQALVLSGVGCHHAGLLYEERLNIEKAFRNRDLPILITTTTLAMGVNLPAHLVIIKNTQQYVNGAYQEYSISTVMQMVGRAGRPQFDTEATAVIMTRLQDKPRYQALVGGDEPLQSYLHKRLAENLNSEAALGTVCDVAQCVQWLRSTFLSVRAPKDPKRYLGLPQNAQPALISKKMEELCVKAMNGLATAGLITMDEASCIESTEAGRLMSVFYLDLETMKHIMKIEGKESLEQLLWIVCECHELADMHLRVDERRTLNTLNRNNAAPTIRFPMKGKINTRQMKLSCVIQAILGCLPIPDPSLNQEAMKVMKIADRVCKCLVAYVTRPDLISSQPQYYSVVVNALTLAKCVAAHLWENSPYVSKQLKGIGPTFSSLLATAGKVNLTLLEESHPRDLERIMNKGAPAGNVLRKQISLLPKYQLTTTPIDEKRINIQLLLLNQHQLAENREQLTAGDSHKCYIVVGDSENYLLLFTSFKDKDLINIYDGGLAYEVTRKHNFEHKILIHCISSNWVGIDVQCDYLFKNIEPEFLRGEAINPIPTQDHNVSRQTTKKQTSITDMYKVRKRKNNEIDITESKEKKKRDTALVEKFKLLKNSFEVTSKEIKEDLDKSAQMSNMIINEMIQPDNCDRQKGLINRSSHMFEIRNDKLHLEEENNVVDKNLSVTINDYDNLKLESLDDEESFVVDDHINTILNEIETEIYKSNNESPTCEVANAMKVPMSKREQPKTNYKVQSEFFITPEHHTDNDNARPSISGINYFPSTGQSIKKKRKPVSTKTNYSFIDSLEKNFKTDNYEDIPQDNRGFSDTIKSQIERFLQRTANTKQNDITIKRLLDSVDNTEKMGSYQITEFAKSETINELPAVNMNLNKVSNDKITLENIYSVHKDNIDNKELLKDTFIPNYTQNVDTIVQDIEREYNVSTKESISLKHEINNLRTNYMKNHNNVRHDDSLKQISVSKNNNNKTSEKNKDNNGENIHEQQYHQWDIPNSESTRDKNMFNISSKEEMEKNHDALKENFQSNTSNCLIPVNENVNDLSNSDKNVEYLYKSLCQASEPFVDRKATKLHIKGNFFDQNFGSKQLHTVPLCLSLTPKTHVLLDNLDNNCKAIEDSNMNSNKNMLSIPTKNESSLQIPNNSDFSNDNYTFDQTCENSAENEKSNDYINRYLFTATKIDVCTKNMSDHQIQIIRKLKLDLDVTEVVSKGNNRSTNGTTTSKQEVQNYQTNSKNIRNEEQFHLDSDCDLENVLQNFAINEDGPVKNKEIKIYTPQREETINETNKYLTDIPKSLTSKSQKQTINNKVAIKTINITKKSLPQEETLNQKVENITDKQNKSDDLEQYKKYLREIAAANAVSGTEENVTGILPETEDKDIVSDNNVIQNKQQLDGTNKIENILQKYSTVLRKSNNVLNTSTTDKNINNDNITRQCNEKSKKPYKISELLNLHIPLPKSLIAVEASRNHRSSNKDILKRVLDIKRNTEVTSPKEIDNTRANKEIANTNSIAYAEDIPDVPDYHSPVADNPLGENTEDYNLDQSMLNPKTLLEQCFSRDENNYDDDEIIPPPSGFCDNESLYSPVTMQGDNLVDFTCLKNYSKGEVATTHDQSLGDNSVLTPEIETWTLSQDNTIDYFQKQRPLCRTTEEYCADDGSQGQYNLKSLTVMRRNSNKDRYLSSKLGKFNYTPKKKM